MSAEDVDAVVDIIREAIANAANVRSALDAATRG
jgi:hypothetical protein